MKKHALYAAQARALYATELMSFAQIAAQLPVSERTLRTWALEERWADKRKSTEHDMERIGKHSMEIALLLGERIRKTLEEGREPSPTTLNAYSRVSSAVAHIQRLKLGVEPDEEPDDPRPAAEILKDMLG